VVAAAGVTGPAWLLVALIVVGVDFHHQAENAQGLPSAW
jgi:hypothetical protein